MEVDIKKMSSQDEERFRICQSYLESKLEHDEAFKAHFQSLHHYYFSKLSTYIKRGSIREDFRVRFYDYISDLIFQGFYLAQELIDQPDTYLPDEFLQTPNGLLKEQLPHMIKELPISLLEITRNNDNMAFENWIVNEYKEIEYPLVQTKLNLIHDGFFLCFIKERERRQLSIKPEQENITGKVHRMDDLLFVTPQHYFVAIAGNGQSEIWQLKQWGTQEEVPLKLGDLYVQFYTKDHVEISLKTSPIYAAEEDVDANHDVVMTQLVVEQRIDETDLNMIVDTIVTSLTERNDIKPECINVAIHKSSESLILNQA